MNNWIAIQLGSREHYSIPRVLHDLGCLSGLVTDSWIPDRWKSLVSLASRSLALRHHAELPDKVVRAATLRRIAFDLVHRKKTSNAWDKIYRRNLWFQRFAAKEVARLGQPTDVCFSYSYTARLPFKVAKKRGMFCVLGQIDPGPLEIEMVDNATVQYADLKFTEDVPPPDYWADWHDEVELADRILVNSDWSKNLLVKQGVANEKILVIPLAYDRVIDAAPRHPPESAECGPRKLLVLFLGQVILRKGVGQIFDVIRMMRDEPIRFVFAGPLGVRIPADIAANPEVQFLGAVDQDHAHRLYQSADVFLLPTLSDGFAITQLEALAHGVPVIASKACGRVVVHEENGLLLDSVSPPEIAKSLSRLMKGPLLARLKANARVPKEFQTGSLANALARLTF